MINNDKQILSFINETLHKFNKYLLYSLDTLTYSNTAFCDYLVAVVSLPV